MDAYIIYERHCNICHTENTFFLELQLRLCISWTHFFQFEGNDGEFLKLVDLSTQYLLTGLIITTVLEYGSVLEALFSQVSKQAYCILSSDATKDMVHIS